MSIRTATVRRQKHNDKNVRMVTNSKAHLRRLSAIHYDLITKAIDATQKVVEMGKKYKDELDVNEFSPTLLMIANQIKASDERHEKINIRINNMSTKNTDPLGQLMDILEDLNAESMSIASGISDPLMDVMNTMNLKLPIHDKFDLGGIEDLLAQLDNDVAANAPEVTLPETNRVMQ